MSLNATVRARIDESLKFDAETILNELGLTTSQAINIFFKKVVSEHGIPFELKIPSKQLKIAMNEARNSEGTYDESIEEMMKDLKS